MEQQGRSGWPTSRSARTPCQCRWGSAHGQDPAQTGALPRDARSLHTGPARRKSVPLLASGRSTRASGIASAIEVAADILCAARPPTPAHTTPRTTKARRYEGSATAVPGCPGDPPSPPGRLSIRASKPGITTTAVRVLAPARPRQDYCFSVMRTTDCYFQELGTAWGDRSHNPP